MKAGELLHDDGPQLDLQAVDELIGIHRTKLLRLAFSVGHSGQAHLAGDPQRLVSEVLRLARTGAIAELEAKSNGSKPVRIVVADARSRWRLEIGGIG